MVDEVMLRRFPYGLLAVGATSVLAGASPAQAILTYNIYQSSGDVIIAATGSLAIGNPLPFEIVCIDPGSINSAFASICTGPSGVNLPVYAVTGPASFNENGNQFFASSVAGVATLFTGDPNTFLATGFIGLPLTYIPGFPVFSSATFGSTTLATLGFTTTGLIGSWTLTDGGDTINVVVSTSAPTAVPAPLPLLGAGAAFSLSRRVRRRVRLGRSTSVAQD